MKVSYNWLNEFFDGKLPQVDVLDRALTFHAWEIEEIVEHPPGSNGDTMIDIKVLPDKSSWAFSHRGVAKDLSALLEIPLTHDPLAVSPALTPVTSEVIISRTAPGCTVYHAAHVRGVRVGESPAWLKERLATLGQRSINNVVDATNYIMFGLGQPLHAFDAKKVSDRTIGVRLAHTGEEITTLTGDTYTLSEVDMVIVDGADIPLGIAGVKGGKRAEVTSDTVDLIIEAAHFDPVLVRKTSQRLKLRTDASVRYENRISPHLAAQGLFEVVKLLEKIAGGTLVGYSTTGEVKKETRSVSVSLSKINSVLGLSLTEEDVSQICERFGFVYIWDSEVITVTPPLERTDLSIGEDLIEEIGRAYGYEHVTSVVPSPVPSTEINKSYHYADTIRRMLVECGFIEVFTSSFRTKDEVELANALASDKGYLRSTLAQNMREVLFKNIQHADLIGVRALRTFEIGTVFTKKGEHLSLVLGAQSGIEYKAKIDDQLLKEGKEVVERVLGVMLPWKEERGIAEVNLTDAFLPLPMPQSYDTFTKMPDVTYVPFSHYPSMSRDIAFWAPSGMVSEVAQELLKSNAGPLLARISLFDTFTKEGKTSLAFRLVFVSHERTLTDTEINDVMQNLAKVVQEAGGVVR